MEPAASKISSRPQRRKTSCSPARKSRHWARADSRFVGQGRAIDRRAPTLICSLPQSSRCPRTRSTAAWIAGKPVFQAGRFRRAARIQGHPPSRLGWRPRVCACPWPLGSLLHDRLYCGLPRARRRPASIGAAIRRAASAAQDAGRCTNQRPSAGRASAPSRSRAMSRSALNTLLFRRRKLIRPGSSSSPSSVTSNVPSRRGGNGLRDGPHNLTVREQRSRSGSPRILRSAPCPVWCSGHADKPR